MIRSPPTSIGLPGEPADGGGLVNDVVTGFSDEAAPIPFGLGLVHPAAALDKHYRLPSASSDKIGGIGIFAHSANELTVIAPTRPDILAGGVFGLLVSGRVFVFPEVDVEKDDLVYCRFARGSIVGISEQAGAFRNAADVVSDWQSNHAYHVGDRCVSGGNLYEYTTAGASNSDSPPVPPTAVSTAADSIADGRAKCKFVQVQAAGASNTIVKGARFVVSALAGVPVPVAFDKLLALS